MEQRFDQQPISVRYSLVRSFPFVRCAEQPLRDSCSNNASTPKTHTHTTCIRRAAFVWCVCLYCVYNRRTNKPMYMCARVRFGTPPAICSYLRVNIVNNVYFVGQIKSLNLPNSEVEYENLFTQFSPNK